MGAKWPSGFRGFAGPSPGGYRHLIGRNDSDLIGQVVVGHRLCDALGSGGTGVVFRAEGPDGDTLAVKVLRSKHATTSDAAQRFLREMSLEALRHPNIVDVHSVGLLDDGRPYLAMELLDGESLEARMERGLLPIEDAVRIVRDVLEGLGAAHRAGVVHRDVKPANVFLARTPDGEVAKVLDFSVARIESSKEPRVTATGDIIGTPLYLAPEQATGVKGQDHRVDLWAAGVLLYHALTGQPPFSTKNLAELILKIVSEAPPRPSALRPEIPAALDAIVLRALSKPVADRYASAADMIGALSTAC